jgi:hypothetical protein
MRFPHKDLELKYPLETDKIYFGVTSYTFPITLEIQTCDVLLCTKDKNS